MDALDVLSSSGIVSRASNIVPVDLQSLRGSLFSAKDSRDD